MKKNTPLKFQEEIELTYEQYFHTRYGGMIQLAGELERVLGREKASEIIGKTCERGTVESTKKLIAEKGPIESFEDFTALLKEKLGSPFWSHALTCTYPEETTKKIALHVTECLWAKTFREMNSTDLGYIMVCHPDFAMVQAFHPKIKLRRTKTLMQGDNCCDRIYYWKE